MSELNVFRLLSVLHYDGPVSLTKGTNPGPELESLLNTRTATPKKVVACVENDSNTPLLNERRMMFMHSFTSSIIYMVKYNFKTK